VNGFVALNVTAPNAAENCVLLALTLRWHQDGCRLADSLLGRIAKETLGALVPTCHDPVEVSAYYRVIAALDNGSEPHAQREGVDRTLLDDFLRLAAYLRLALVRQTALDDLDLLR
jgi:hypothetical protein